MGKCPKCGKGIEYIDHIEARWVHSLLEKDGELYWKNDYDCDNETQYQCPECNENITSSFEEAVEILNRED